MFVPPIKMGRCPKPRRYSGNKSRFRFLGYACGERDGALFLFT